MTIDISLIPQERIKDLISTLDTIQSNINNIGTDLTNNLVHKTGDETISGFKTIENNIFLKDTQGTIGTSTNKWARRIQFTDSAGTRIARLEPKYVDATILEMGMYASNGTTTENGIWVRNTGETYAPHPTTAQDSSNRIATTAWVNNLDNSVVHKTGNEEINGIKTFNGSTPIILNNTTGKNCRLQLKDSTTTYGDSGVEIFQATSNNFNQFLIHFMNGNQYPFHIDQDASDSSKFTTYIDKKLVKGFVTETYSSGTNWYRVWSDGFIEQGGYGSVPSSGLTVTFHKSFSNTNYSLISLADRSSAGSVMDGVGLQVLSKTSSNFKIANKNYGSSNTVNAWWRACGY